NLRRCRVDSAKKSENTGFRGLLVKILDKNDRDARMLTAGHLTRDKLALYSGHVRLSYNISRSLSGVGTAPWISNQVVEKSYNLADVSTPLETVDDKCFAIRLKGELADVYCAKSELKRNVRTGRSGELFVPRQGYCRNGGMYEAQAEQKEIPLNDERVPKKRICIPHYGNGIRGVLASPYRARPGQSRSRIQYAIKQTDYCVLRHTGRKRTVTPDFTQAIGKTHAGGSQSSLGNYDTTAHDHVAAYGRSSESTSLLRVWKREHCRLHLEMHRFKEPGTLTARVLRSQPLNSSGLKRKAPTDYSSPPTNLRRTRLSDVSSFLRCSAALSLHGSLFTGSMELPHCCANSRSRVFRERRRKEPGYHKKALHLLRRRRPLAIRFVGRVYFITPGSQQFQQPLRLLLMESTSDFPQTASTDHLRQELLFDFPETTSRELFFSGAWAEALNFVDLDDVLTFTCTTPTWLPAEKMRAVYSRSKVWFSEEHDMRLEVEVHRFLRGSGTVVSTRVDIASASLFSLGASCTANSKQKDSWAHPTWKVESWGAFQDVLASERTWGTDTGREEEAQGKDSRVSTHKLTTEPAYISAKATPSQLQASAVKRQQLANEHTPRLREPVIHLQGKRKSRHRNENIPKRCHSRIIQPSPRAARILRRMIARGVYNSARPRVRLSQPAENQSCVRCHELRRPRSVRILPRMVAGSAYHSASRRARLIKPIEGQLCGSYTKLMRPTTPRILRRLVARGACHTAGPRARPIKPTESQLCGRYSRLVRRTAGRILPQTTARSAYQSATPGARFLKPPESQQCVRHTSFVRSKACPPRPSSSGKTESATPLEHQEPANKSQKQKYFRHLLMGRRHQMLDAPVWEVTRAWRSDCFRRETGTGPSSSHRVPDISATSKSYPTRERLRVSRARVGGGIRRRRLIICARRIRGERDTRPAFIRRRKARGLVRGADTNSDGTTRGRHAEVHTKCISVEENRATLSKLRNTLWVDGCRAEQRRCVPRHFLRSGPPSSLRSSDNPGALERDRVAATSGRSTTPDLHDRGVEIPARNSPLSSSTSVADLSTQRHSELEIPAEFDESPFCLGFSLRGLSDCDTPPSK
ncbi:unnamed protein product, partial [Rangifer tarandus platyrhynchus]